MGGVLGGEASCQRGQGLREGQIVGKAQTTALMKVCGRVSGKRSHQDLLELVKTKRAKRWVCRTPAGARLVMATPRAPRRSRGDAAVAVATAQVEGPKAAKAQVEGPKASKAAQVPTSRSIQGRLMAAYGEPKTVEIMHRAQRLAAALQDSVPFGPAAPYPAEAKKAALLSIATALEADTSQGHPRPECDRSCCHCGGCTASLCRDAARGIAGPSKAEQQMVTYLEKRAINHLWGSGSGGHDERAGYGFIR